MFKKLKKLFRLRPKVSRYQMTFHLFPEVGTLTFGLRKKDRYGQLQEETHYKIITLPKSMQIFRDEKLLSSDPRVINRFIRLFTQRENKFKGQLFLNLKVTGGEFNDLLRSKLPKPFKLSLSYARAIHTENLKTYVIELKD